MVASWLLWLTMKVSTPQSDGGLRQPPSRSLPFRGSTDFNSPHLQRPGQDVPLRSNSLRHWLRDPGPRVSLETWRLLGASRYPSSHQDHSRAFMGPPSGDYGNSSRDPDSSSFHSDASFQAQEQNWDNSHRSFSTSALVSNSSPSRGATGAEDYPPLNLPRPLITRKTYGELLAKVLVDLNLPHFVVESHPPMVSTGPQGAGLAVDEVTLREVLDAFAQQEPKIKLTSIILLPSEYCLPFANTSADLHLWTPTLWLCTDIMVLSLWLQ